MAAFINTNFASLNAQRNLTTSQSSLTTSLQRLSSGLRINSAKDDAAGLAISERFTTQIRGVAQAARNANDGISLAQTAEGTLGEIGNNLQRIRELAVQSRNSTNSDDDRAALNAEVDQLKSEIGRVAGQANFNGTKLLDGNFKNMSFQVGANQGETISIDSIANANVAQLGTWKDVSAATVTASAVPAGDAAASPAIPGSTTLAAADVGAPTNLDGFNYDGFSIQVGSTTVNVAATTTATTAAEGKTAMLANVASAINAAAIPGVTADGSVVDELTIENTTGGAITVTDGAGGELGGNLSVVAQTPEVKQFGAIAAGEFKVNGVDITVGEATGATAASDRVDALVAAINANVEGVTASKDAGGKLSLTSASAISVTGSKAVEQTGLAVVDTAVTPGADQTGFANVDVTTVDGADKMILAMDAALKEVNSARAGLGAIQNRFSSVIANLTTTSENLAASRSRIQDTDFAAETASLTRGQILQQAGTAMLAQANSLPNGVLALLRG